MAVRCIRFLGLFILYVVCLATYDPVFAISEVHRGLGDMYRIDSLSSIKSRDDVMTYIDFFIKTTYQMASALVDANTMDTIDPARCFDPDIEDICRLMYWRFPDYNASASNFVNRTHVMEQMEGTSGLTPERPIIFESRKEYPRVGVVALAPVVRQTRAATVRCAGFGDFYNSEVLGAGRCMPGKDCSGGPITSFQTPFTHSRSGRAQHIYLTYDEPAFQCVDRAESAEVFQDKSWSPMATWGQLEDGVPLEAQKVNGEFVWYKFVPDVAYLQAPLKPKLDGAYISWDDPMWRNPSVKQNPRRKRWINQYLADKGNRRNTFLTFETSSLAISALIVSPQGEKYADIMTLAQVSFSFPQYGSVRAQPLFRSASQTFFSWDCCVYLFWVLSTVEIFLDCIFLRRSHKVGFDEDSTAPQRYPEIFLIILASAHLSLNFYVDKAPPHMFAVLKEAFQRNSEQHYFAAFEVIRMYTGRLETVRFVGFVLVLIFVMLLSRYLIIHPRLGVLLHAVNNSGDDICHIVLALLPLIFLFACLALWMFGKDVQADGFENLANSLRSTVPYVLPGVPNTWLTEHGDPLFIVWALACLLFMRLFYIVCMASIVKAFQNAKEDKEGCKVDNSFPADIADALKMSVARQYENWPEASRVLRHVEMNLDTSSAVTAAELARAIRDPPFNKSSATSLLRCYSQKVSVSGKRILIEPDARIGVLEGNSANTQATAASAMEAGKVDPWAAPSLDPNPLHALETEHPSVGFLKEISKQVNEVSKGQDALSAQLSNLLRDGTKGLPSKAEHATEVDTMQVVKGLQKAFVQVQSMFVDRSVSSEENVTIQSSNDQSEVETRPGVTWSDVHQLKAALASASAALCANEVARGTLAAKLGSINSELATALGEVSALQQENALLINSARLGPRST